MRANSSISACKHVAGVNALDSPLRDAGQLPLTVTCENDAHRTSSKHSRSRSSIARCLHIMHADRVEWQQLPAACLQIAECSAAGSAAAERPTHRARVPGPPAAHEHTSKNMHENRQSCEVAQRRDARLQLGSAGSALSGRTRTMFASAATTGVSLILDE